MSWRTIQFIIFLLSLKLTLISIIYKNNIMMYTFLFSMSMAAIWTSKEERT